MRANQPMGLSAEAIAMIEQALPLESERFYEGYWDERFPLYDYLPIEGELVELLAERSHLEAELTELEQRIQTAGRARLAAGAAHWSAFEQATLYSSGPCMFLALHDQTGQVQGAWAECAMEAAANGSCSCGGELCVAACNEGCRPDIELKV